jgi:hypothetical protein
MVAAGRASASVLAPGETLVSSRVSSDSTGAFLVPNLPPGDYEICGEHPSVALLNPCKWSTPPRVTISAGAESIPSVVLKRGVFLNVRVNDATGLLSSAAFNPVTAPDLIVGVVYGTGAFLAATVSRIDGSGRDYQMAIPYSVPLQLSVTSRHVAVADSQGLPVDTSGARLIPFKAAQGLDQFFILTVTGSAGPVH